MAVTAPPSLDPRDLETHDALQVAAQVFDGLISYEPETQAVLPAVAESWEVLDDGTRFEFRIRAGVTFHDGSPVTADSFVTAWNRLADPVAAKPYAFLLESVDGFARFQERLTVRRLSGLTAPDERTLSVVLNRPWPDFVALLGHPALSPVPASAEQTSFATEPVGNGPYRVTAPLSAGSPLILQASPGYYGVPPAMPTLEMRTVDAPEDAWPEFVAGDLEVAEIPGPLFRDATSRFGDRGVTPLARFLFCGFNEADERFADPAIRTAASLGLDRTTVVDEVYGGLPLAATGIVPPGIPGHVEEACGDACTHDPERAAAALSGVRRRDREFALDYAASPTGDRLAALLVAQLQEIGLRVTPRPHDEATFESVLEAGQHEMFCLSWVGDYPRQQALLEPLLASGSPDNHGRVEDPAIDELLERARTRRDASARQQLYVQVEREALAAMHVIPVVWFRSRLAVQPYVEGFTVSPLGLYDAATVSLGFGPAPSPEVEQEPEVPGVPGLPGEGPPGG